MSDDLFIKAVTSLPEEERSGLWTMAEERPWLFLKLREYFNKKCEALQSLDTKAVAAIMAEEKEAIAAMLKEL